MKDLGWQVGNTHPIENDICDVIGKLMVEVKEEDRTDVLDSMQRAMMNIREEDDTDKLKPLLLIKKKYNCSNLACILLEQVILDNKESEVSWMRIVCTQFIDLVVQALMESDYQGDTCWTLNYLLKLETDWKVVDIYNLTKNGILIFQGSTKHFPSVLGVDSKLCSLSIIKHSLISI